MSMAQRVTSRPLRVESSSSITTVSIFFFRDHPGMKNIASVLGDDRAGEEEEDLEDLEDWVDPLDGLPIWQQLLEESKRVDWPAPGKVFKTLSYVYGGMIGAAGLVLGVDKLFLAVGKLVFTYGVNPNV